MKKVGYAKGQPLSKAKQGAGQKNAPKTQPKAAAKAGKMPKMKVSRKMK